MSAMMTLEEVERRLRGGNDFFTTQDLLEMADAIKAHREALEMLADRWERDFNVTLYRTDCANELRRYLPPQKSALQRAIEMVEMAAPIQRNQYPSGDGIDCSRDGLLALLREAEKEAKR